MLQHSSFFIASFLCFVAAASANPITYDVTVDTSFISGTSGSLDFNFNPGLSSTQAASLQILGFTSDGTVAGSPVLTGNVSGALPSMLVFDNGSAFNDYFDGFSFGNTISFDVNLYGPALSAPDGVSTSGSTFAFSMFSDAAGTVPALTTDLTDGFAFKVDVNLDGTTTLTDFSAQTTIGTPTSLVPEPRSLPFLGTAMASMLALIRFGKRAQQLTRQDPSL